MTTTEAERMFFGQLRDQLATYAAANGVEPVTPDNTDELLAQARRQYAESDKERQDWALYLHTAETIRKERKERVRSAT